MGRSTIFRWALAVSLLFHLSTVTLFRIVIYFPREDVKYVHFEIVPSMAEASPSDQREVLTLPSQDGVLERVELSEDLDKVDRLLNTIPPIQLPTIEFAGQDLLRMRTQGLEVRARYKELFKPQRQDVWSRFGQGLDSLGDAISRVTHGSGLPEEVAPTPISHPAPGFDAYLEWMEPPREREPISVEKIEALWGMDPTQLSEPIVLYFKVNRDGKVVSIIPHMEDDDGVVMGAIEALFKFRFEGLDDEGPSSQSATLVISAEREAGR